MYGLFSESWPLFRWYCSAAPSIHGSHKQKTAVLNVEHSAYAQLHVVSSNETACANIRRRASLFLAHGTVWGIHLEAP